MNRKTVSAIMLTLMLTSVLALEFNISPVKSVPTTWYVDDDGGVDFTEIQDAIWAASSGDTIYVYNGTYYENLYITKDDLVIMGESQSNTIIDGGEDVVIKIESDELVVNGFTVRNGGQSWAYATGSAIFLDRAQSCNISDNIVFNSRYGIASLRGTSNTLSGNMISETNQGIALYYCPYETVIDNSISNGVEAGSDPPYGVQVYGGARNWIIGNRIANVSYTGIQLSKSTTKNVVRGNIVSNTSVAVSASHESSSNTISGNNLSENGIGIEAWQSDNNILTLNNSTNNDCGIMLSHSSKNIVAENNLTDNHSGIYLGHSSDNGIFGNNITNNNYGVMADESSNNSIAQNSIAANNYDGIWLVYLSNSNGIIGNNITANNRYGIWLWDSSDNRIFHNNFITNTYQAFSKLPNIWDDGYPSGGNYWSDQYHGNCADHFNGSGQDIPGSDGIVDIAYLVEVDNQDDYPLMEPWISPEDTVPPVTTIILEGILGNSGWFTSNVMVTLSATDDLSGVWKTEYTVDSSSWTVYDAPFVLTTEGVTTVCYKSTDFIGNVETVKCETLKMDKTAPNIVISLSAPAYGSAYTQADTLTITYTAVDSVSGLDSTSATLDGEPFTSGDSFSLLWFDLGDHSVVVAATDNAGNSAEKVVNFKIMATLDGLTTLIYQLSSLGLIDDIPGTDNSLIKKLHVAHKLVDDGKIDQAKNILTAFINEVQAQSGKHITPEAADILIESAEYILSQL